MKDQFELEWSFADSNPGWVKWGNTPYDTLDEAKEVREKAMQGAQSKLHFRVVKVSREVAYDPHSGMDNKYVDLALEVGVR